MKNKDQKGLKDLEIEGLNHNSKYKEWECTEKMMNLTKDKNALYLHCLPADISGVSCKEGEVQKEVFEKYRIQTYKEASYKPYIIASMILNNRFKQPASLLNRLLNNKKNRML
jgi:ornithine carbamoyltransferase